MSTARNSGRGNEALFVAGVLGGTLVLGIGFVFLILGISVGVREVGTFATGQSQLYAMLGGVVGVIAGVGLRSYRHRLDGGTAVQLLRHGGSAVAFAGVTAFLIGFSAEQTNSAPFLTTMNQKVLLVMLALATLVAGWFIIRLSGRRIGW